MNDKLPELDDLSSLLTAQLAGGLIDVRRVIARPAGLELVLADSCNDGQRGLVELLDGQSYAVPGLTLTMDISCLRHGVPEEQYCAGSCPDCTRPDPLALRALDYGKFTLPFEAQWFPEWDSRQRGGGPSWPPPTGWLIWGQIYSPSISTLAQNIVRIEDVPDGATLRVCYDHYGDFVLWIAGVPWVIDSGYMPGDPFCDQMGGSVVIRKDSNAVLP